MVDTQHGQMIDCCEHHKIEGAFQKVDKITTPKFVCQLDKPAQIISDNSGSQQDKPAQIISDSDNGEQVIRHLHTPPHCKRVNGVCRCVQVVE